MTETKTSNLRNEARLKDRLEQSKGQRLKYKRDQKKTYTTKRHQLTDIVFGDKKVIRVNNFRLIA